MYTPSYIITVEKKRLLGYYLNMENFNSYRKEEMNSISTWGKIVQAFGL